MWSASFWFNNEMDHELAKALKEAGFPQTSSTYIHSKTATDSCNNQMPASYYKPTLE